MRLQLNNSAKSDLTEAQGNEDESCRYFEKMDEMLGKAVDLERELEKRGVKVGYMAVKYVFVIYTKRHAEMVEKFKVLW